MKKVTIEHFMKNGNGTFTETWKLREPLVGDFKTDKARLLKLIKKDVHKPHKSMSTAYLVVSWGENSFLLRLK